MESRNKVDRGVVLLLLGTRLENVRQHVLKRAHTLLLQLLSGRTALHALQNEQLCHVKR